MHEHEKTMYSELQKREKIMQNMQDAVGEVLTTQVGEIDAQKKASGVNSNGNDKNAS